MRHRADPDDTRIGHAYALPHEPRHRDARTFSDVDPGTQLYLDVDANGTPRQRADRNLDAVDAYRADPFAYVSPEHARAVRDFSTDPRTERNGIRYSVPLSELELLEPIRRAVQASFAAELDRYVDPDTGSLFRLP